MATYVIDEVERLKNFFKVLSEQTRVSIILLLRDNPLSVSEITLHLKMEQSAISHQLRILYNERFVTFKRQGKAKIYEICDNHIYEIIAQAREHVAE